MEKRITPRGTAFVLKIGDLVVTYVTGKDADATTPVFTMSVGETTLENRGPRPINLKYNTDETFFRGHRIEFGANPPPAATPHSHRTSPDDLVDYDLKPGQKAWISRQDLMDPVLRRGPACLADGTVTTRFVANLQVDHHMHTLDFGPHRFIIAIDRDWDREREQYVEFFRKRDGR